MILFVAIAVVLQEILTTIRNLVTSKKVQTGIATVLVGWASKHGLDLDPVQVAGVYLTGITVIFGFALQDHGKERAKIEAGAKVVTSSPTADGGVISTTTPIAPNPAANPAINPAAKPPTIPPPISPNPSGFVRLSLALAIVLVGSVLGGVALSSCGSSFTAGGAKTDALNCAGPSAAAAIRDYGPATVTAFASQLTDDGKLMKPTIESLILGAVTDEAKCVGLNSLAKLLTPANPAAGTAASSPRAVDVGDVRAELERMKSQVAPGRAVTLPAEQAQ